MITVVFENERGAHTVFCEEPCRLSEALEQAGLVLSYPCGGNGTCGNCRVRFAAGAPSPNQYDRRMLSEAQLKQGYRIACQCIVSRDCRVLLAETVDEIHVPFWEKTSEKCGQNPAKYHELSKQSTKLSTNPQRKIVSIGAAGRGIAIDIGTTTLAFALYELGSGECIGTYAMANHQAPYGADVLSRIRQAGDGRGEELTNIIRRDLAEGICRLLGGDEEAGGFGGGDSRSHGAKKPMMRPPLPGQLQLSQLTKAADIRRVVIAANTAMCHLLLGYPCKGLGEAPFAPYSTKMVRRRWEGIDVTVLPGVSAFVGGDIVAGLYWMETGEAGEPPADFLFLDLGTNGEMALRCGGVYYCASAAAGPALEGGGISCGMAAVPGAICRVFMEKGVCRIETIGDKPAVGICGSGIVDAIACLRRAGILDDMGMLAERYREEGYPVCIRSQSHRICMTQEDVQNVLLAKSAIAAGICVICREAGVSLSDLENVYLAGGFGVSVNAQSAAAIGLLPQGLGNRRIVSVGNTSLKGAAAYLLCPEEERLADIISRAKVIPLAQRPEFEELFLNGLRL